jgi:hypothetical protein
VQRDDPLRAVGDLSAEPGACLGDDLFQELGCLLDICDEGDRLPEAALPPRPSDRLALRATASSPVMASTSVFASSLRRRSHAPIECARRRTERVRSRKQVRAAKPICFKEQTVRASLATPLASRPESVG